LTHSCAACRVGDHGTAAVAGQHLIQQLLVEDDALRWQEHMTDDSLDAIGRILERGSQIVVTSHERPMREIQAIALLLRNAGVPLQVLVNDGTTRIPVPFAVTGRSPLHLVSARAALRRGDSMLFVLWRAPMRPRGMLPWEAVAATPRPAVGPIVLARRTGRPITLVRLEVVAGVEDTALVRLVEQLWSDSGAELDAEARLLTQAIEPRRARAG
jgi:hypothetical protein